MQEDLSKEIVRLLYEHKMILTWYKDNPKGYKLASSNWSPFYINLRMLSAFPNLLKKIGYALSELIKSEIIEKELSHGNNISMIGLAMAGIPLTCSISHYSNIPFAFTRKIEGSIRTYEEIIQKYGTHSLIEGRFSDNDKLILIDDLVSFFTSKKQALDLISYEAKKRGINVFAKNILVLIDREQGASFEAKLHGVTLTSLIPFMSKGIEWLKPSLEKREYVVIKDYLENPSTYQNHDLQHELEKEAAGSTKSIC